MSAEVWTLAKVTQRLKQDKYGRVYFNIEYESGAKGGVYLAMGQPGQRDLIWSRMSDEEEQGLGS